MKKYWIGLVVALLLWPCLMGAAPVWIQYSEPLAGENSPTFTDTINRPAKTIWNTFLIEHDEDGFHNLSALGLPVDVSTKLDVSVFETDHNPDGSHSLAIPTSTTNLTEGTNLYFTDARVTANTTVMSNSDHRLATNNPHGTTAADIGAVDLLTHSTDLAAKTNTTTFEIQHNADGTHNFTTKTYALYGNGTGNLANGTFAPSGHFTGDFSIWGFVLFTRLNTAESIYSRIDTGYSLNIINLGKAADNTLSFSIGANTIYSSVVLDSNDIWRAVEVGIICEQASGVCRFIFDGEVYADQAMTFVWPAITNEAHVIGEGFAGYLQFLNLSNKAIFNQNSFHSPLQYGVHQCPRCLSAYTAINDQGVNLWDFFDYTLSVSGEWREFRDY